MLPAGASGIPLGALTVPEPFADPSGAWARRLDPLSIAAIQAVAGARQMANLPSINPGPTPREGICAGTAYGSQQTRLRYASRLLSHGLASTNPIDFPDSVDGAAAAHVALTWHLMGPSFSFLSGVDSAYRALTSAAQQLLLGAADRMHVVVGDVFDPRVSANTKASASRNAVMALVLELGSDEPAPLHHSKGIGIELVGVPHPAAASCEMVDVDVIGVDDHTQFADSSGVNDLIAAWRGAYAPLETPEASWHAERMHCEPCAFPITAAGGRLLAFFKRGY